MRVLAGLFVFCLLLIGAGFCITHIDWENYRPELAAQISDALGAEVKLNGPLSITFFPYPKLSAEDAELRAGGIDITMPHLRLAAKLWPLLGGHVVISSADIQNPKIAMNPAMWQAPRAAQDFASRTKVQLEDVEIENGELDITLGQNHEVMSEIDMQLRAPDWHGPYQANANFIWHGFEWDFLAQLGIKTDAGTRPANFTLKQVDGPNQFSWRGAAQPVPFIMHGDGVWQSSTDNLSLQAETNYALQILEIKNGLFSADGKVLGSVHGHFAVGPNKWQDLDANLDDASPGRLSGLGFIHLDPLWHKFAATGRMQFRIQGGVLANLQFSSPDMTAILNHDHWHFWGRNAANVLALWGQPDVSVWPSTLMQPFDARIFENQNGAQIESLKLGRAQLRGSISNQQLSLQMDSMNWPTADGMDIWRGILREMDLQKFSLDARQWDLAPFASGEGKMVLTFGKNTDHLQFETTAFSLAGQFQNDDFKGELNCHENRPMVVFHAACGSAKIASNGGKWQVTSMADDEHSGPKWNGAIDFDADAWTLNLPFSHGQIVGNGKFGQNDWHMDISNLGLSEFLQIFVPSAPKGDGDISAQLHITPDKAEGDMTASNLQLSGLNLFLDNPAQSGKIVSVAAKVNVQGDVLELQQLRTIGPDGIGHASLNLDSGAWHGDWADARGNSHVGIDGAADFAVAQRYRFSEASRN